VFEVSVDETNRRQIRPADDAGCRVVERDGQLSLQMYLATFVDNANRDLLVIEDDRSLLRFEGLGFPEVDIVADVDGLLHVAEALVGASGRGGDEYAVVLHRRGMAVVPRGSIAGVAACAGHRTVGLGNVTGNEDVADMAVVAALDRCVAGDVGAVRCVVRSGALGDRVQPDGATDQVVNVSAPLAPRLE